MTSIALVRHGPTDWNATGRIQGHTDTDLSQLGRSIVSRWQIPTEFACGVWISSPLRRAVETAQLLGCAMPRIEPALIEMDWGTWEGASIAELRARLGAEFTENQARGLDLMPPGGETPRHVCRRLENWLRRVARSAPCITAITHKGVIRAALCLATGWDMRNDPPVALDWGCAHVFHVDSDGALEISELNVTLDARHGLAER